MPLEITVMGNFAIFFLSAFTIIFIFAFFGYGIYKLKDLSKEPLSPPLEEVDDK